MSQRYTEFYVFGLQRSGTNYLQQLLELNFENFITENDRAPVRWKHTLEPFSKEDLRNIPIFVIAKNPYKWIESVANRDVQDFARRQKKYSISGSGTVQVGKHKLNLVNTCKTYKEFYENWHLNAPDHVRNLKTFIQYENLLNSDKRNVFLDTVVNRYSMQRKSGRSNWENIGFGQVKQSKTYNSKMEEYYKDKQRVDILTPEHLKIVNETLTHEFITKLGYELIS